MIRLLFGITSSHLVFIELIKLKERFPIRIASIEALANILMCSH